MRHLGVVEKLHGELGRSSFDAILLYGFDHLRYVTGATFAFLPALDPGVAAILWKKGDEPRLLVPSWLRDTFRSQIGVRNVQGYGPGRALAPTLDGLVETLAGRLGLRRARIGTTLRRIPRACLEALHGALPQARLEGGDDWIRAMRMTKTAAERGLLAEVARKTDHALAAAAHHVMVYASRPEKGLSEIIRVHCLERGLDMSGYESLAVGASGSHAALPWPEAPWFGIGGGRQLAEGELVRMEIRSSLEGYWTDAARLLTMGPPSAAQSEAYGHVCRVREESLGILRSGVSCSEAAQRIDAFCTKNDIPLLREHGMGHGVGVTPVEPPFVDPSDNTRLEEGMVLVLSSTVLGPDRELVRSYDTVVIGRDGAAVVGWYRDWNTPYKAVRSWQHGGG